MSIAKSIMNDGSNGIDAIEPKKRKTRGDIPAEMPEMETNPTHAHTQDGGLHLDRRNYRKHNERNKQLINKSLKDYGAGRSILADKAGNELLSYRESVTPAEVIKEFRLREPRFAEMCRKGLFA